MEYEVNEVFERDGRRYRVQVEKVSCRGCAFRDGSDLGCSAYDLYCSAFMRKDGTDVVFVLIDESPVCGRKLAQEEARS